MIAPATALENQVSGSFDPKPDFSQGAITGASAIERSLRLGAAAVGRPLAFTETGSYLDGKLGDHLPGHRIAPVTSRDGAALGSLRVVDFTPSAGFFGASEAAALADVAALIANELETAARIAQTDHVSGLPNRKRFVAAFPRAARSYGPDALLILVTLADARHYNELLRALGHSCAEDFVRESVEMVRRAIGQERPLFHVSVLSLAFFAGADEAEALAREVVRTFWKSVICQGLPISTRAGVGLVPVGQDPLKPAETLRAALAAAQDSRRSPERFSYYDRGSDEAHLRAFTLLSDLGAALRTGDGLALAYQPRIDLLTGSIAGAEALIRWNHPMLGAVSPMEFIPLVETTALIGQLTRWVLRSACAQAAAWRAEGLAPKISVNVSPANLREQRLFGDVLAIFGETGVEPDWVEFEFTEGTLTSTEPGVTTTIDAIRAMGVTIAIDDFGTGYSNLDYLTRVPADVLKLDRSFVQPLEEDLRRRKLVKSMIDLAHDLGFKVVAEGVETAEVSKTLAEWRCDEGQGYYFGRPIPAEAFRALAL